MRTSTERKDGYAAKNIAATVSLKVASRLSGMKTGFASAVQSLVPKEIAIQSILNYVSDPNPIPTIKYPFYLNFGRELWALTRKGITGFAATQRAQALTDYYQAHGCVDAVLIQIALTCFGLVVS